MDKLNIAHTALGKLIEDIEHYKKLKAFYNDWVTKHPHAHVWEEPDDEIRERLEEYQSYYPYQFKQQLLVIGRLIKEVASKMQGESYE